MMAIFSHMAKSNNRTAAEGKHVAAATRRRRRILQAGFFFIVRFGIGEYNKYMLDFKRDDCKTLLWYREEIMMVFGVMIAKGTY
ncbi:MAG: hypothetical protein HFI03_09925 [Lachnospiraceae bacterium]|nr:hypothetical protein [Lachnospiraceae bacterium]